jgi:glycosyltransferase involved in cell wall biosynthesis
MFLKKKFLLYFIKYKRFTILVYLASSRLFKKQAYWVVAQLLNRGYLDVASALSKKLKYKKHFDYIFDRVDSMEDIKKNGINFTRETKDNISDLNILFAVHNSMPYDNAGYAIRTHSIATKLKENNISVIVATRAGYPWDIKKHRHLTQKTKIDTIDSIKYLRLEDKEKTFKRGSDFKYIDTYSTQLVKIAKRENITILHAHSNYLNAWSAIKAGNILKIPVIYEIRGLWYLTRLTKEPDFRYGGMFEYEQQMVKYATSYADKIVTISYALKELVISWGIDKDKIEVIPNAVNLTLFNPQSKSLKLLEQYNLKSKMIIGFIGTITAYEGLDILISTINELVLEGYDITLMIVGDGLEKQRFEKLVKVPNIVFTGRVEHSKVEEYYSIFDVCVYPRNDYEVCRYIPPLKPLEAMAMQKAIIVSNVGPLVEIVDDNINGLVCLADNQESLKEKILLLYNDEHLRTTLAINARKWVEDNRSWDLIVKKYIMLYNSFRK